MIVAVLPITAVFLAVIVTFFLDLFTLTVTALLLLVALTVDVPLTVYLTVADLDGATETLDLAALIDNVEEAFFVVTLKFTTILSLALTGALFNLSIVVTFSSCQLTPVLSKRPFHGFTMLNL